MLGASLVFCLVILSRFLLLNGFSILNGDRYDAVISTAILEHWFKLSSGTARWDEMNYFFPYKHTIGQTDAFFLIGLVYIPLRWVGLDPFLAQELAGLAVKSVGFFGAYLLCRKVFALQFYWALLVAILFTLSNGMTSHASRFQLSSIAFAPVLATLLWTMICALIDKDSTKFKLAGIVAGLLFGAWCLTCFYMAWFFAFFFTVLAVTMLTKAGTGGIRILRDRVVEHRTSVAIVIATAVVSLAPFIYVYMPKSYEVGVRSYETASANTVKLEEILQVGYDNTVFGRLYNGVLSFVSPGYSPQGEYYNTGFAIVLFLLFVGGCVQILAGPHKTRVEFVLASAVIATLITWLLVLNVYGHSLWFFVYNLFPGAKALNAIATYQIFLTLPVVVVAVIFLSKQRMAWPVVTAIAAILVAEEINTAPMNLNRNAELARIALPHAPPKECRAFYVSGWQGQEAVGDPSDWVKEYYAHNVTAIMVAQTVEIPTVNGIASFSPRDWDFAYPNRPDYDKRVLAYSRAHGISGLCRLDLNSKLWSAVEEPALARDVDPHFVDFKRSGWPGVVSSAQGLSHVESWGTWSEGGATTLEFSAPLPEKFAVHLVAQAFGPNVGKEFVARVGDSVAKFTLGGSAEERVLEFSNPMRSRTIEIDIPAPASPDALGMSGDERNLGIGLVELRVEPP